MIQPANTQDMEAATATDGLELAHEFSAPRELVFRAWTEARHLKQWWGPAVFRLEVEKLELKPGGSFLYCMITPDELKIWGKFVYVEIIAPERLVYTDSFTDETGRTVRYSMSDTWPLEVLNTVIFTDQEGRTRLRMHSIPANATAVEKQAFSDMKEMVRKGFTGTFAQLEAYLSKIKDHRP